MRNNKNAILLINAFLFYITLLLSPHYTNSEILSDEATATKCSSEDSVGTCHMTNESHVAERLTPMTYDLGQGQDVFHAYVVPDVSTFYEKMDGTMQQKTPVFQGFAGKFVNMSPDRLNLMWDPNNGKKPSLIGEVEPFHPAGTATFPGHLFYFTPKDSGNEIIKYRFSVEEKDSIYVYDPFISPHQNRRLDSLSPEDFDKYMTLKRTIEFSERYKEVTGRDWLSRFPRDPPTHFMWKADYFGQTHEVTTKETHFLSLPPKPMLKKVSSTGESEEKRQELQPYRSPESTLNMTLKVLSCAPRAFEIQNFLSETEIQHILKLSTGLTLSLSTVSDGETTNADTQTRSSTNSWVNRNHSPVVDAIYRRAADLLRIDEALLRPRKSDEYPDYPLPGQRNSDSIAEAMQLVHYEVGQQYTPHHDFGYPPTSSPVQNARFATLLLYLNEGMEGGATTFPRYVNADTSAPLRVVPKIGKAVLFYSFLPDGNFDDLSQHAAEPVQKGEKWLMNLWVWDPVF